METPTETTETPVRTCKECGAGMTEQQDWCLNCGTARPGRLGTRPGWRAAAAVSGATLMLVCGAVAASYAALTDDAGKKADEASEGSATPIAQAPVQVPGVPTDTQAQQLPTNTFPTTTAPTGTTGTSSLPSLPTLPNNNPTTTGTSLPTLPTTTGTTTTGTTTTGTTTTTTTTTTTPTNTSTTETPAALTPIALGADAADLYDPYQRSTARGAPGDAYDPNAKNAWFVTAPSDGKPMQVGLLVDLGNRKNLKQIEFKTTTPGFRLEVYGTDGSALPPDILDTRWTHLASRSDVDQNTVGDNKRGDLAEIVRLAKDGEQVRQLVLWFTTRPDQGSTVRIREIVLKG